MKRIAVLTLPIIGLAALAAVFIGVILATDRIGEAARVGLVTGALGAFSTLAVAYGGWVFSNVREANRREHEWNLAHATRLYERRAAAYERILTHLARTSDTIHDTLPFWAVGGQEPDPMGAMSPDEWRHYVATAREDGAHLIASIVAYGSPQLKDLLQRLKPVQAAFWTNVYRYRAHRLPDGTIGGGPSDYYAEAHKIREQFDAVVSDLYSCIETELAAPAPQA